MKNLVRLQGSIDTALQKRSSAGHSASAVELGGKKQNYRPPRYPRRGSNPGRDTRSAPRSLLATSLCSD